MKVRSSQLLRVIPRLAIVAWCFTSSASNSADITFRSEGRYPGIYLEGTISPGDSEDIRAVWLEENLEFFSILPHVSLEDQKDVEPVTLYLNSPGGDALEAFKIGRFVRDASLIVVAPSGPELAIRESAVLDEQRLALIGGKRGGSELLCASSCAFIWLAGRIRHGNLVAFHRPFAVASSTAEQNTDIETVSNVIQRETRTFFDELGVDTRMFDLVMAQSRDEVIWLDEAREQADIPYYSRAFEERILDACAWSSYKKDTLFEKLYNATGSKQAALLVDYEDGTSCAKFELLKLQAAYWNEVNDDAQGHTRPLSWIGSIPVLAPLIAILVALGVLVVWFQRRRRSQID